MTTLGLAVLPFGEDATTYLDVMEKCVKNGWNEDKPELDAWMKEYSFISSQVWDMWGISGLIEIAKTRGVKLT